MTGPLVLCYHAVSERWPSELAVTPDALHAQLSHLLARGYTGTTFTTAVTQGGARTLAVTFDDGYRSVLELAFPVLERLGVPGTVYVPTAWPGERRPMRWPGIDQWSGGPWEDELRSLSWDELGRLADAGWEIGSHTRTHPRLTELPATLVDEELAGSRRDCERAVAGSCTSIAYPYGDVDARVVDAARRAGYVAGAALPRRAHAPRALEWPRVGVTRDDTLARFRRQTHPLVRRFLASPVGPVVERAYGAAADRLRRT
jgi:peptidoglycan/xylan/chitin deacetylase (PgdA/CDA1 family)